MDSRSLLHDVADRAADWLEELPHRPVGPACTPAEMDVSDSLQDDSLPVDRVIAELAREAAPGLTAMGSPRYFGFVIGGAHPAGVAADWLASAWDQNAGLAAPTPAVSAFEEVAGRWLAELLDLPRTASFALVTGCQMAHVVSLAAARHRVLGRAGHDAERDGLFGAPPIRVLTGEERHVTVDRALRLLGLGSRSIESVPSDGHGAMRIDALLEALDRGEGQPTIVVAQAGNVNTGAIDPMEEVCGAARAAGAWVHVDGAFGLWAAASPSRRPLVKGVELADSWATDAHKWLNVPYDCGIAFVRDREAHRAAMAVTAAYLQQDANGPREPMDWTPEFSRRARGLAVYATLRALGCSGVAELVDRLCECADRFARQLGDMGFEVVGHSLNQVLIACRDDAATDATLALIQADGTCYPTGTTWRGRRCIRISVCNWQTTLDDVDRSLDAMAAAAAQVPPRAPL
ncbi:MAG: aspartate aminotransferase family protein [Solirubrobacterales bacterium]|nr:aspartate aminotransferase family protein [Solirubrobacterales bacterium]